MREGMKEGTKRREGEKENERQEAMNNPVDQPKVSELIERLRALNPWKDMDWPETVNEAANALSALIVIPGAEKGEPVAWDGLFDCLDDIREKQAERKGNIWDQIHEAREVLRLRYPRNEEDQRLFDALNKALYSLSGDPINMDLEEVTKQLRASYAAPTSERERAEVTDKMVEAAWAEVTAFDFDRVGMRRALEAALNGIRYIASVFYFPNGNVAVFDQEGRQMPEYQGLSREMKGKIDEAITKQKVKPEIQGEKYVND